MKHIVIFLGILGLVTLMNGFMFVGIIVSVAAPLLYYFFVPLKETDLSEFYSRLPTVFQNITETILLAELCHVFEGDVNIETVSQFYRLLEADTSNFEIKINIELMEEFERIYDIKSIKYLNFTPVMRALYVLFYVTQEQYESRSRNSRCNSCSQKNGGYPEKNKEETQSTLSSCF